MKTHEEKSIDFVAEMNGIETLETRNSDELDFYELAVWEIKKIIIDAYMSGRMDQAMSKGKSQIEREV